MIARIIPVVCGALALLSCSSVPERVTLVSSEETNEVASRLAQTIAQMDAVAAEVASIDPDVAEKVKSLTKDVVVAQNRLQVISNLQKSVSPAIGSGPAPTQKKAHGTAVLWALLFLFFSLCVILFILLIKLIARK